MFVFLRSKHCVVFCDLLILHFVVLWYRQQSYAFARNSNPTQTKVHYAYNKALMIQQLGYIFQDAYHNVGAKG